MKIFKNNYNFIFMLLLYFFAALLFSSCEKNEKPQDNNLPKIDNNFNKIDFKYDTEEQRYSIIGNWFMDARLMHVLNSTWHGMGNIGEILDTASRIRHTSELSWYREWYKTAERVRMVGDQSLENRHFISAGESYLRASGYYFAGEVMLHTNPDDPRILETYKKASYYFDKSIELLKKPVQILQIPYENSYLRGIFYRAENNEKAPILLVHQGFEAPIETTKYIAEEAVKRGYNCLLFDGPGQGLTLRENKIPFRPDWEKAVSSVISYIIKIPTVDQDNIILVGISIGGGLAVRAAAYEKRIKICIVNPGYISIKNIFYKILTEKLINLFKDDPEEFDKTFKEMTQYDVGLRWAMNHGIWAFGAKNASDFMLKIKEYDYEKDIPNIKCKMLIMDGTRESYGPGQALELYNRLKCPKYYMLFTEEDAAAGHCQGGAQGLSTVRMFDWLDENL